MNTITTLIIAAAVGLIGFVGYERLSGLEARMAGIESLLLLQTVGGVTTEAPGNGTDVSTGDQPTSPKAIPEAPAEVVVGGAKAPQTLARESSTRSYLDELLDLTRPRP